MTKKVGVVLAGCGYLDGAEIHEAVITMLVLDRASVEVVAMAPDKPQAHVVNHLTGEEAKGETRNVLVEAARIARGKIRDVDPMIADSLDAVIMVGGFGAAKNISSYAFEGTNGTVDAKIAELAKRMHEQKKPIGAMCIAPMVVAKIFEKSDIHPAMTIGTDTNTARDIEALKSRHLSCSVTDFVVDRANKIVTTPAWMLGPRISDVEKGIEKLVGEVLALIN
ncbi:MAG: isoprenoid biosynthesis glyoxalase ElbB [bacterium]|nr:isoprenoid biosynthesis glyoxalase ElbB [bacterium]